MNIFSELSLSRNPLQSIGIFLGLDRIAAAGHCRRHQLFKFNLKCEIEFISFKKCKIEF